MRATVLLSNRSKRIGSGLHYNTGTLDISVGSAVRVPLRHASVEGIVLRTEKQAVAEESKLKTIEGLLAKRPLLTAAQLGLVEWIAEYYCCAPRQVLSLLLPPLPWGKLLPEPIVELRLRSEIPIRGKKQLLLIETLQGKDWTSENAALEESGASKATVKMLQKKGAIERRLRTPITEYHPTEDVPPKPPELSCAQLEAFQQILGSKCPSLLLGAHGSGKTYVYASLIVETVKQGKQGILLLPEIALSEDRVAFFEALVGKSHVAFVRGNMALTKRRAMWRRIWNGDIVLVIGSRSALFAPCGNLGLIIVDDEHDWAWKNEQTPRFHARDAAVKLGELTGAHVVLGSATPSLESWAQANAGHYQLVRLRERYKNIAYPSVRIINLHEAQLGKNYPLSTPLLTALAGRLERGEKSLLLLNRRGLASALLCLECRQRLVHPATKLPYTVHRKTGGTLMLVEHTTGDLANLPACCPRCGSARLHAIGAGTQRLESVLKEHFPNARLLRIDKETLAPKAQVQSPLEGMRRGQYDILLGTQSVLKGLSMPSLTLVAVVLADLGLSLPYFRAGERVWQMLSSLTGWYRDPPGDVLIQTFQPESPEILAAATHDTEGFLHKELEQRTAMEYPPVTTMIRFLCKFPNAQAKAQELANLLKTFCDKHLPHPQITFSPTLYSGGNEWHVLLRAKDAHRVLQGIDLNAYTVDVDPMVCL